MNPKLTPEQLHRKVSVFIRQSRPSQLIHNQESTRLQRSLADRAPTLGFQQILVIDDPTLTNDRWLLVSSVMWTISLSPVEPKNYWREKSSLSSSSFCTHEA